MADQDIPTFAEPARLRVFGTDEQVVVRQVVLGDLPDGVSEGDGALTIGGAGGVTLHGRLQRTAAGEWVFAATESAHERAAYRLTARHPVTVRRHDGDVLHAFTRDVSLTGVLLDERALPLELGEEVRMTIELGTYGDLPVRGTVARCPGDGRAVRYLDLGPAEERTLQRYIADEQRRLLARRR